MVQSAWFVCERAPLFDFSKYYLPAPILNVWVRYVNCTSDIESRDEGVGLGPGSNHYCRCQNFFDSVSRAEIGSSGCMCTSATPTAGSPCRRSTYQYSMASAFLFRRLYIPSAALQPAAN